MVLSGGSMDNLNELKINDVLKRQLINKGEAARDKFLKEFEALLNKYRLPHSIKNDGLRNHFTNNTDTNINFWMKRVDAHFVSIETEQFLKELYRLENYFNDKDAYF